ncbi:MAG: type II secretion system protein N [Rhodoferax sp.]|nr:type II secretion system protein N [Rhodoferax sp.]
MQTARPYSASASTPRHPAVWRWAIAGALFGVLAACVLYAPAVWLQGWLSSASNGRLVLRQAQGTVWHGSAEWGLGGGPGSSDALRLPGRVQWDVRVGLGSLHIALSADCCTTQPQQLIFSLGLRSWRLQLEAGESTWPAAVLAGLGTPWNTVQLQGAMRLKTSGLSLVSAVDRVKVEGAISLDLPNLGSSLSTLRPLGSYRLQLQGGEQTTLDLRTVQGSLQLQGTGRWTAGRLRFVGEASAETGHETELSNLLNILGRREGARSVITLG